ncbi:MAG: isoprenyl transferase [Parvibaculales bacterium]
MSESMDISAASFPTHVAITMDGNGRWANARGLPRQEGHRQGVEALRRNVNIAGELGISCLTLFSFSSENWSRPQAEVSFLMTLLQRYIEADLAELHANGVRVRVIGRRQGLEPKIRNLIDHAETVTAENEAMLLQIAFNYGGRQEIADAASRLARRAVAGTLDPANISESVLASELLTAGVPDPDLLIRTGGEMRISNFLLWQCAYAEFFFTDVYWPDFDRHDWQQALDAFAARERRFGNVGSGALGPE